MEFMLASDRREQHRQAAWTRSVVWTGALVLAVVLWGGYSGRWSSTGINGRTATLWDWLHLLLLPAALALLPPWLSRRTQLTGRHKALVVAAIDGGTGAGQGQPAPGS